MERDIANLHDHVIVCGWGRVGRADRRLRVACRATGRRHRPRRRAHRHDPVPAIQGDVTEDDVLTRAGIERRACWSLRSTTDADNLYVTLSSRTLRPDMVIISRARNDAAEAKLQRAGANRS